MEYLQYLLDSSSTPIFTAFLLGLLTALSPCPLATNITAIGFISKDIENKHKMFFNGLLYTFGRIVTYVGIAMILIPILKRGSSIFAIQKKIGEYGEILLPPVLILIGLFMLFGDKLKLPKFGYSGNRSEGLKKYGGIGTFLLGVLFALAFCPTSGVFYFGMLIPMASVDASSYLLPLVFAIATGLPVVLVAWILSYSISNIGTFYNKISIFQLWFSRIVAIVFIAIGVYYGIIYYL